MAIVGAFDLHRHQITFEYRDDVSGEVSRGRVEPGARVALRQMLGEVGSGPAEFVVEGCTGWRFVAEELAAAGMGAHVADPAEASRRQSPKKRAKTDRADAHRLCDMLARGEVPESWVPPAHVLDTRDLGRLYLDVLVARNSWAQRVHATLFQHGINPIGKDLCTDRTRAGAEAAIDRLPEPAGLAVRYGLDNFDRLGAQGDDVRLRLGRVARNQPAARRLLDEVFGVGRLLAPIVWAELGDCRRFSSSAQAVRHTGLDVTVHSSDGKRTAGRLSRQGPGALRWALYEAATCAARRNAPDHDYYLQVKARRDHGRATLAVARKIARRCHHILRDCGDDVLAPIG